MANRRDTSDIIIRPPLRPDIWTADGGDTQRVEYARAMWHGQDNLFIRRDRQIEENIRMLAGQQWAMYSKMLGRFVDISHWFTDRERRWRQRPVFNLLLGWFMLTHARLTENPPIIAFQPATGDRTDAELAEVMDTIFKILWQDTGMLEVIDRIVSWLVPGGSVYWKTIVDPNIGDIIEWGGKATLEMESEQGGMIRRTVDNVPFNDQGEAQAHLVGRGDEWEPTGKAFREYEGGLSVEVYSPLQIRGQWSNMIPWHQKRVHQVRSFMTPEEVWDRYQVDVPADASSSDTDRTNSMRRVMMGSGFFGAIENLEEGLASFDHEGAKGYVDVLETWEAPSQYPGMQRGVDEYEEPGGRLLTVTRNKVLRDGMRPAPYRYTSPVRHLPFVNLPGRPQGTSPQDSLNPQQRTLNRRWAQILEHANLMTNPVGVVDKGQGLQKGDITDEPGQYIYVNRKAGQSAPPLEYVSPPTMGEDSWRTLAAVRQEFESAGNLEGNTGRAPTRDASGELVKELRFNEDRYIAATSRRFASALGRMTEDWIVTLPYIWSQEKTLAWAGDDTVLKTILVTPELFEKGRVNVIPDIESMLPEGRGERQTRIAWLWQNGAFGDPASPAAIRQFMELSRFPHLNRAARPGGSHLIMAETENGKFAQGAQAADVPIFEWQDHALHAEVHVDFMAGPDYQKLPVEVQQQFVIHLQMTRQAELVALQISMGIEGQKRVDAGATSAAVAGELEEVEAAVGPVQGAAPDVPSEGGEGADPDTAVA